MSSIVPASREGIKSQAFEVSPPMFLKFGLKGGADCNEKSQYGDLLGVIGCNVFTHHEPA